jgi:hypothetical protein
VADRRGRAAREEVGQELVDLRRALDLRDVAAAVEHDLLGARQPLGDDLRKAGGDEPVVRAPDEQRRRLQLAEPGVESLGAPRLVEIDVARGGQEGVAGAGRAVGLAELVDHEVGDGGVDRVAVGEQRPEAPGHRGARDRMGQQAELRAQDAHERVQPALDERDGRAQQPEPADAVRRREADLDRDPPAHRVAGHVGPVDGHGVHRLQHRLGEPASGVRRGDRLRRAAEAGEVERVHAVAGVGQGGGGLEERALGSAEAVEQQHVRARAGREDRDRAAGQAEAVDAQQRRAPVGQAEAALEAHGEVDRAARVDQAPPERLGPRQLALAQAHPRARVRADDDVGPSASGATAHAGGALGEADLPGAAEVAEADLVAGVEAALGAQIPLRQGPEGLVDLLEQHCGRRRLGHGSLNGNRIGGPELQ